MLSVVQQICYDLQIWFDHRLSLAKCFFRFNSTHHLKRGKEKEAFQWQSNLRLMERILPLVQIIALLLEKFA